jgi:DNA/RNA endonuclease YhcR with UshA esterase domain
MQAYLTLALLGSFSSCVDDVIAPAEARTHVNRTVVVEMVVQSAKNRLEKRGEIYLDSELDFHDAKNLGVVITRAGAVKFKAIHIEDPAQYFRGKKIRVTGVVTEKEKHPRIEVNDPKQIRLAESGHK